MRVTKLTSVDGFVVVDLPEARTATGVVRCARKILQDGAVNMARTLTYTYAAFGVPCSGASAGVNAEGDDRDDAVATFVEEVSPLVESGLSLAPGKGVTASDLAAWNPPVVDPATHDRLLAASVTAAAAAAAAADGLSGTSVAVESNAPGADAIVAAFIAHGADAKALPTADLLAGGHAIVVVGSKPAVLDHENVGSVGDALIVGAAPLAITARGLATALRAGARVLADFVSASGPVLGSIDGFGDDDSITRAVAAAVKSAAGHVEGDYLGACYSAEEFLRTWVDEMPFGRPLA